jgi:hypothetical protein
LALVLVERLFALELPLEELALAFGQSRFPALRNHRQQTLEPLQRQVDQEAKLDPALQLQEQSLLQASLLEPKH